MIDAIDTRNKWLEEKFEHINTVLGHVRESVDKVREEQSRFITRCDCEMNSVSMRVREIERRQDEMIGATKSVTESRSRQNLTWQMMIAVGTAFSSLAALIGYFMGKG